MTSGTTECGKQGQERGQAAAQGDRVGALRIYSNQTRGECEKTAEESLGCLYELYFGSQMCFVMNTSGVVLCPASDSNNINRKLMVIM